MILLVMFELSTIDLVGAQSFTVSATDDDLYIGTLISICLFNSNQ